jgi:diguanylate cyclase (GGDEF)-like protein
MALITSIGVAASVIAFIVGALWEQRRALMEQAMTDPLTGAFNRRYMDACLATAIERRNRTGEPASLLMIDVDHFKRINDSFGHAGGDEALKRLVALVSGRARKLDVLFRVGGEEFMILLPGTRYAGAMAAAENLRLLVAHSALIDGQKISVSIGVSELQMGQSVSSWVEDADVAVYRAKQSGRNRVRMSGRMPAPPASHLHH